jgi:hypothetical protein
MRGRFAFRTSQNAKTGRRSVSRAFVREDAEEFEPESDFGLPPREDPSYEAAATLALLEAALVGKTRVAEAATGLRWGEPQLFGHVQRFLDKEEALPEAQQNRRFMQVARRFLQSG